MPSGSLLSGPSSHERSELYSEPIHHGPTSGACRARLLDGFEYSVDLDLAQLQRLLGGAIGSNARTDAW